MFNKFEIFNSPVFYINTEGRRVYLMTPGTATLFDGHSNVFFSGCERIVLDPSRKEDIVSFEIDDDNNKLSIVLNTKAVKTLNLLKKKAFTKYGLEFTTDVLYAQDSRYILNSHTIEDLGDETSKVVIDVYKSDNFNGLDTNSFTLSNKDKLKLEVKNTIDDIFVEEDLVMLKNLLNFLKPENTLTDTKDILSLVLKVKEFISSPYYGTNLKFSDEN